METELGERPPRALRPLIIIGVIVIAAAGIFLFVSSFLLNWIVFERMYQVKLGIDWFSTIFFHGYSFIFPAIIAFISIFPYPKRSDLFSMMKVVAGFGLPFGVEEVGEATNARVASRARQLWAAWQALKWLVTFAIAYAFQGFILYNNMTEAFALALYGYGSWALVPRIILMPIFPASGQEIISLIPTMQAQYYLVVGAVGITLIVLGVRFFLKFVRDFLARKGNRWIIDLLAVGLTAVLTIWLGVPYWAMNVTTPYLYGILLIAILGLAAGMIYFRLSGKGLVPITSRRRAVMKVTAVIIIVLLVVNAGTLAYLAVNGNNNWLQYYWTPQIQKQINVTQWAAGISNITTADISQVPTGNVSQILSEVRQWDTNASLIRSQSQIGVNYLSIPNAEIVYLNGHEYWFQPTTVTYPPGSTDWISEHLIYTHADRIVALNAHNGSYVSVSQALGVPPNPNLDTPLIYYGQQGGFYNEVYVNVKNEPAQIGGVTYNAQSDYNLSGALRTWWFFMKGPTTWGFAFTPPQDSIEMLYNRDVTSRVASTLIPGLTVNPDTYLVTDGSQLYFAIMVYINYPLQTGFAQSNFLRNFGVVLVNVHDGSMHPYIVDNSSDFLSSFFRSYYPGWDTAPPTWLVPQLRQPDQLLGTTSQVGQFGVDFLYHVTQPSTWRSGSDFYERPPGTPVYYIVVNQGNTLYYVGLQLAQFLVSPGQNLGGIYVASGGSQLNQDSLYSVNIQSNSTNKLIGPSAALQALETYQPIKEQLTLLTNPTIGNVLPYLINGQIYYFIPVYVNTAAASAVISKLAFMVCVDATTGAADYGQDSAGAYTALITSEGVAPPPETAISLANVTGSFTRAGYTIVRPTTVNVNVGFDTHNILLNQTTASSINSTIGSFLTTYAVPNNTHLIYEWSVGNVTNFGVIVSVAGVPETYYISVYS